MATPERKLAVALFEGKSFPIPVRTGQLPWTKIVSMHSQHDVRADKDGYLLGGYKIIGTRNNRNVKYRSIIQLDIDTEGKKDKSTGRILRVIRTAPTLDEIRSGIAHYEWVAVSSHWHEPRRGVVKYRIVMLPDRDIMPDEHEAVLEALDELVGGVLDRAAWPLSQAFYLPSCPAESEADASFVHNEGAQLPVDEFVRRGRKIIAAKQLACTTALPDRLGANLKRVAPPETPEEIERAQGMLAAIDTDCDRTTWMRVVWAVLATGWVCAEDLAREWSQPGSKWNEDDFEGVVKSFKPDGGISFGTLVHIAKQHGWEPSKSRVTIAPERLLAERVTGDKGDVRNGKVFAELFRDKLLFVYETNDTLKFDTETGWVAAPPYEADRAAKEALAEMRAYAAERWKAAPEDKNTLRLMTHVERSSQLQRLRAMIDMAKSEPGMTVSLNEFDADPMLLGVVNGVLDLRTGKLLSVSPDVRVSKRTNIAFDPDADCPRFEQFLCEVQLDKAMQIFLQRFTGYCLTGQVDEQVFAFLYGLGRNGKSVFIETLAGLLGDYAHKIPTEMLMQHQRNPQAATPEIVALKGRRFVYATETEDGARLAAARVKEMTGGDSLTGRVPYGAEFITFRPTHKLVIVGNHKPEIGDNSFGMWRRVLLTPFETTLRADQCDPQLDTSKNLCESRLI